MVRNDPMSCSRDTLESKDQRASAISILTMKNPQDFDGEFFFGQEEDAVISNAEAKLVTRWLELFHVARACGEITVDGTENAPCSLSINGTEISASFRRPNDGFLRHESGLPGRKAELA